MPRIDIQRHPFSVYTIEHQGNFCKFIFKYITRTRTHTQYGIQSLRYPNKSAILKAFNRRDKRGRRRNKQDGYDEEWGIGKPNKRIEHPRRYVS